MHTHTTSPLTCPRPGKRPSCHGIGVLPVLLHVCLGSSDGLKTSQHKLWASAQYPGHQHKPWAYSSPPLLASISNSTRDLYMNGNLGRVITKYTVKYGVFIRSWPTLSISYQQPVASTQMLNTCTNTHAKLHATSVSYQQTVASTQALNTCTNTHAELPCMHSLHHGHAKAVTEFLFQNCEAQMQRTL